MADRGITASPSEVSGYLREGAVTALTVKPILANIATLPDGKAGAV